MNKYRFRAGNSTTLTISLLQLSIELTKQENMYMQTFRYFILPVLYSIHIKQNNVISVSPWAN